LVIKLFLDFISPNAELNRRAQEEKNQAWLKQRERREEDLAKERQKIIEKNLKLELRPPEAKDELKKRS
jgi:hypothetical protein